MKVGALLQILSLELGLGCNLCAAHSLCPNALKADRYAGLPRQYVLDEATIVSLVETFYWEWDFRGWVNFSFYNEPLLDLDRLLRVATRVTLMVPELKLMLITNGTLLPADPRPLRVFDWISVTDYGGAHAPDLDRLAALTDVCGVGRYQPDPTGVFVNRGKLDGRLKGPGRDRAERPCVYPFKDLAIDYFGNCHLCCYDWRGEAHIGNVLIDGVPACLTRWERVVKSIAGHRMAPDAPRSCRCCRRAGFQQLERLNVSAKVHAQDWLDNYRK